MWSFYSLINAVCMWLTTSMLTFSYLPTVDCGPLSRPPNGNVATPSGTTVGNVASYSCNEGLVLIGSTVRSCGNNGLWAPDTPTCEGQW